MKNFLISALSMAPAIRYKRRALGISLVGIIILATCWLYAISDSHASAPASSITDTFLPLSIYPYGAAGVVNELNISITGIDSWRSGGDPYSPEYIVGSTPNPEYPQQPYGYLYRVDIPPDFADDSVLIQIFDPDNYNRPDSPPTPVTPIVTPTHCPGTCNGTRTATPYASPTSYGYAGEYVYCWDTSDCTTDGARYNTGLRLGAFPLTRTPIPSGWQTRRAAFWRVDEIRKPHDATSWVPGTGEWSDTWVDTTTFSLWHFDPNIDNPLGDPALLSDQPGGGDITAYTVGNEPRTDLSWYQPPGYDIKLSDASDPTCTYANHECYARQANGHFYFYVYVKTSSGSSENSFDFRAGPRNTNVAAGYDCTNIASLTSGICAANNQYFAQTHSSNPPPDWDIGGNAGAQIEAVRSMPLNLDTGNNFPLLLTNIKSDLAGASLGIRHFDQDCTGGCGPNHTMVYQMQKCVMTGGTYAPCADLSNDNCFGNAGTGYVGPDNDWYCTGCPAPEIVNIPLPGSSGYTQFFGPNGECSTSWLRLQSDPSYSQDTTTWEIVLEPSPSATATSTGTFTSTATRTATSMPTNTPVNTATSVPTNTRTNTPVNTATNIPTNTATNTPVNTATNSPTNTPVNTATNTPANTATNTSTSTNTPTNTPSNTPSNTPTGTFIPPTATLTPTNTPTNVPTSTQPVPSATEVPPTQTALPATETNTSVPTQADTATSEPTQTAQATSTTIPTKTATSTAGPTNTLAPTPACSISFSDVQQGDTFYSYVQCLACKGIINGYPDGTFRPGNNVTRGQLAKIVSNSAGFQDVQTVQMFEDVQPGSAFFDFVDRLAARGYMSGYPCGGAGEPCDANHLPYFRPGNNSTRGQIAKIVSNSAGFAEDEPGVLFSDVPLDQPFHDFIGRLASRGYMSGYPCGGVGEPCGSGNLPYFRPGSNATRGQTSKIVANTFFPDCQAVR